MADGITFAVEWSDTLAHDWSAIQVTETLLPGTDNGTPELWKATTSARTNKRFLHLNVSTP
jgi:hypothetical protein